MAMQKEDGTCVIGLYHGDAVVVLAGGMTLITEGARLRHSFYNSFSNKSFYPASFKQVFQIIIGKSGYFRLVIYIK